MANKQFYHTQIYPDYLAKSLNRLKDETKESFRNMIASYYNITLNSAEEFNVTVGWDASESKYVAKKISIPRRFAKSKTNATMDAYILADALNAKLDILSRNNQKP